MGHLAELGGLSHLYCREREVKFPVSGTSVPLLGSCAAEKGTSLEGEVKTYWNFDSPPFQPSVTDSMLCEESPEQQGDLILSRIP